MTTGFTQLFDVVFKPIYIYVATSRSDVMCLTVAYIDVHPLNNFFVN